MKTRITGIIASAFIFFSCTINDDIDPWLAQRRIIAAYEAKMDQCRQERSFEPFVFGTHREWVVRNCEGAILGAECPLLKRPDACFLLLIPRNPD